MDVKVAGITQEIMSKALQQAKAGREHILGVMRETIAESRADISPHAPKIISLTIPVDKIRDVIGPGGKIIKGIQEESGAEIEIEDDGTVRVIAINKESSDIAVERIKQLTIEPEIGAVYEGPVKSILAFGAFVEILPNRDGLLHISEIAYRRLETVEEELAVGDIVKVKVIDVTKDGKVRLSAKALKEPPEGYTPPPERERSDRPRSGGGGRGSKERSRR
jgi:polyribonucleotide nucleotidyltransferase